MKPKSNFDIKYMYNKKLTPYKNIPDKDSKLKLNFKAFSTKLIGNPLTEPSFKRTSPDEVDRT